MAVISDDMYLSADELKGLPLDSRQLLSERPLVHLQDNILILRTDTASQLVVPENLRRKLFDNAHAGPLAAHLGSDRTSRNNCKNHTTGLV